MRTHRTEPAELTVKPPEPAQQPSPTVRRIAQSKALQRANPEDPLTLPAAIAELTEFIKSDPTNPDLYFMRALLSCHAGAKPETTLSDISKSLPQSSSSSLLSERRNRLVLRAKIEFDTGRYEQAMHDLDVAIAEDYETGQQIFNDGRTTPSTTSRPCVWTLADIEALSQKFPADHRPYIYRGLYLTQFMSFDLDADYKPVLDTFSRGAALNASSPLPHFYIGELYTVGHLGGLFSKASATCLDYVVPRTAACLALDDARRTGIRALTRAIAADSTFTPAYALRANALYAVKEYRQAIRDYDRVLATSPHHDQARILYNDRALAKLALRRYRDAIVDLDRAIKLGCHSTCSSFDNRAEAYLKLHDYASAIRDLTLSIHRVLSSAILLMNIEQFRQIYPEYDDVADDHLAEKLRIEFFPSFSREQFTEAFVIEEKHFNSTVLPELYIRRGDAYASLGDVANANREYDRVSRAFPEWASVSFTIVNGKRVRTNSD